MISLVINKNMNKLSGKNWQKILIMRILKTNKSTTLKILLQ